MKAILYLLIKVNSYNLFINVAELYLGSESWSNMNAKEQIQMSRRGENIRRRQDKRWEGRYIISYDEITGRAKYRSVYADSYREVKKRLTDEKEKVKDLTCKNKGKFASTDMMFKEILYQWLDGMKLKIKPQTYGKYYHLIEKHMFPYWEDTKINELSTAKIHQFLERQSVSGRLDQKGGVASGTLRTMGYIIKSAIDYAVEEGMCDPVRGKIIKPPSVSPEVSALTLDEQMLLEKYLWDHPDRSRQGILLCLYTGLRLGEICGLKWEDIDLSERAIKIRRTVQRVAYPQGSQTGNKTELMAGKPKSLSSVREIPLPSFLISLFNLISEEKDLEAMKDCYFLTDIEKIMEPRTYQYRFKTYLKEAGLPPIKFHILRHTFATRCLTAGVDIKSLSEILGHSNADITLKRYVHSSLQIKRYQIERTAPVIWGKNYGQDEISLCLKGGI